MMKYKIKKPKNAATEKQNGNGNPFEPKEAATEENQEYPAEINPFLMKPTKSMKKADKKEKKRIKKEEKTRKKEEKKINGEAKGKPKEQIVVSATQIDGQNKPMDNEGTSVNESATLPTIRTPEYEDPPPQERRVSQTLDSRSEKPPQLNNKRILELQTGREITNQPAFRPPAPSGQKRPTSLEVPLQARGASRGLSPVKEHRSPSPLVARPHPHPGGNEDMKMYRTASISKKGKDKKKKKKLKKMFKKKKNAKGKQANLLEDQDVAAQVVLRHPQKNRIEELQREVNETSESIRSSVISLVEQRNVELDKMVQNTKELEDKSHGFAIFAQEARLKKQASATCCGMWKKWRVCWYICACQTSVKKKKKWEEVSKNKKDGAPEDRELLNRYSRNHPDAEDDDDDFYKPAGPSTSSPQSQLTTAQINPRPSSHYSVGHDSLDSGNTGQVRNKLARIPKALRASLPSLLDDTPPLSTSLRKNEEADPRMRRPSSVGDLREIAKTRAQQRKEERQKKQREKERLQKKKGIAEFASQYQDEETRNKVEDLLCLDLDSP